MAKLQEYLITLEYIKGRNNVGADSLSRISWASITSTMLSSVARKIDQATTPVDIPRGREQDLETDLVKGKEWLPSRTNPKWHVIACESQDLKT